MPSSTQSSNCSVVESANAFSSSTCGRTRATTSSQPSQLSSPESVQSDASRAQIRSTIERHAAASSLRLARMPSSSSSNESANFCTPSASSVATTSS